MAGALAHYLRPTWCTDSDSPAVKLHAETVTADEATARKPAVAIFHSVRDGTRYVPYSITADPADCRASTVPARRVA